MSEKLASEKIVFRWVFFSFLTMAFSFAIFMAACKSSKPVVADSTFIDPNAPFQSNISETSTFEILEGKPLSEVYGDVSSVKVVYNLNNKQLYYINSNKYEMHYDFCTAELSFSAGLQWFNNNNYSSVFSQQFVLANLNFFKGQKKYILEFTSSSKYSVEQIETVYRNISGSTFFGDQLEVLINSDHLRTLPISTEGLKTIFPSELYRGQEYQLLYGGICRGRLRVIANLDSLFHTVDPRDIIVFKGTPAVIPHCKGMITDMIQTPLSHISILGRSRKIPAAADLNFMQRADIMTLDGKWVELTVQSEGVDCIEVGDMGIEQVGFTETTKLVYDLDERMLLTAVDIRLKEKSKFGNKAAAFGELYFLATRRNSMFSAPEGSFSIPFYYYDQHVRQPVIKSAIDSFLNNGSVNLTTVAIKASLKRIRNLIREQPMNGNLIGEVEDMMKACDCGDRFRFRSSSNAEDAEGFSGAGLYSSATGTINDTSRTVADAIREVWASTWNFGAYMEREYWKMDHRSTQMGILVHRGFPDEDVNGVVVSSHLYRTKFTGHTVNLQLGDIPVVDPPDSTICEQYIATPAWLFSNESKDVNRSFITYSSLKPESPLLTEEQSYRLYIAVEQVKEHFYYKTDWGKRSEYAPFSLDIEFKLDKNGKLYLKQVRPY